MFSKNINKKLKWSCMHFIIGAILLCLLGLFIINFWFDNGRYLLTDLFGLAIIILSLDLILGPLLSLWLLSPIKSFKENAINISVILLLQFSSLGYGMLQIDSQRLAYIIKWQGSYFAVTKGDSRKGNNQEQFYTFKEPAVGSEHRASYESLIKNSISPIEMFEFFEKSSFEKECGTICGVITKKGVVNVTKENKELVFNKSLH
ncbi:fimbrial assembly protein [Pseudoalteromonas carrageenovora]|uniref:fimbrial assembly protein n=1 Tax=Pseudoalteromonas carrageenovora TaxID=227 RepID=UPI0026E2A53B|nr:fimbrial assembly protein [Pseudoalteromonas carrageenovora]MDO6466149.1 fimbrial assembly protein [Pseudoalteromonas carrageenovora]